MVTRPSAHAAPRDGAIAALAALAIAIHVVESAFPSPLPGVKPGLANVVTLIVLWRYGFASALWVTILRVVAGSLLIGSFLSPTFVLSAGGAGAALVALWLGSRLPGRGLSPLGYAVAAAVAHMCAQIALAYWLFIPHPAILKLSPVLLSASLLFGLATGIIAARIIARLSKITDTHQ